MATNIIAASAAQLPAHLQEALASGEITGNNQSTRNNVDQLTFRGKVWRAVVEGVEQIQANPDGDPVSTIKVVILAQNPARSRMFYEGQYKEGENRAPTCFSSDGKVPDSAVAEPCDTTCASCPNAAKGSRVNNDGTLGIACSTFKNLVVVPAYDLNFPALRLRLPQTSIWDKNQDEKGWFAYDNFMEQLRVRGIVDTSFVVTKIKFDQSKAYPKLLFSLDTDHDPKLKAFLTAEEFDVVRNRKKEDFSTLLGTSAAGGTPALPAPTATPKAVAAPVKAAPKPKVVQPLPVVEEEVQEETTATADALGSLLDDWDDA